MIIIKGKKDFIPTIKHHMSTTKKLLSNPLMINDIGQKTSHHNN